LRQLFLAATLIAASSLPHARTITPGAKGPNRLDVDVTLLAQSASDLRDVRLIDGDGREVGYLLIQPRNQEPKWTTAALLAIAPTKTTSGFEADLASLRQIDRLRIRGINAPYLKHATLEGSGDRGHWTMLADTTVFDLPDQNLRRPEIAFDHGSYRYLRVTWDDRTSARITGHPSVEARLHDATAPPEPLRASMPFQRLSSEPARSRYRVTLPGPHLPIDAVEVQVSGGDVFRAASVTEPELANGAIVPTPLGSAQLRRAVRDGFAASEMSVPIHAPSGRELQLIVEDGSNAPLPITGIVVRFAPQPWIYFESPDGAPITVVSGDDRAQAPAYDLEAARPYAGRSAIAYATWSSSAQKITRPVQAAAVPLPGFGPTIDRSSFHASRAIAPAPRGLVILPLDADILARSRSLGELRIVDGTNRQVPYIVEHRDEPLRIGLAVPRREESEERTSRYPLRLPYETLPAGTRIVIRTDARVFERTIRLVRPSDERRGREEHVIAEAGWRNADPDTQAAPMTFDAPLSGTATVDLIVGEGDNAPLPISSIELLLPSYALRFEHPGGALTLLYGNGNAAAPQYDLALLAPRILTEPAKEIGFAGAISNKPAVDNTEIKYFWIAIAGTAIMLLALLARLLAPAMHEESRPLGETPGGGDSPR
jgi:uncharacterized protein DUF3999